MNEKDLEEARDPWVASELFSQLGLGFDPNVETPTNDGIDPKR